MQHAQALQALSNQQLVTALAVVARDLRTSECRLLAYLGEMDERRLAVEMGYASLFAYCTEVLRFSEATTCRRIAAARVLRRYPRVGDQLAAGRLHVTAVAMLAPHLTPANHQEVLKQAEALTKRDLERLIATLAPRADQPDLMRRLPKKADAVAACFHTTTGEGEKSGSTATAALPLTLEATPAAADAMAAEGATSTAVAKAAAGSATVTATTAATTTAPATAATTTASATAATRAAAVTTGLQLEPTTAKPRDQVLATAPARVLIRFAASEMTAAKLERAKALLAHTCPDSRLEDIVDKALEALLDKLDPARKGARAEARKAAKTKADAAGSNKPKREAKTSPVASIAPAFAPTSASTSICPSAPTSASAIAPTSLSAPTPATPSASTAATDSFSAKHRAHASPTATSPAAAAHRRHIPAEIRHFVWQRDQGRCTFTAKDGTRCPSRHALELDHIRPFALGGSSADADNIRLLCRTHNQLRAAKTFGPYDGRSLNLNQDQTSSALRGA